jgi:tagaturonate reductase
MKQLNRETGESRLRTARPQRLRYLQFGEGRFLRAFADRMIDQANEEQGLSDAVIVVKPRPGRGLDAFARQDGLYTVLTRGMGEKGPVDTARVIGAVTEWVHPHEEFECFIRCAHSGTLRYVISNTTEAGIVYRPEARPEGKAASSFPGMALQLLWTRYQAMGQISGSGLVFLPCELIEANGDRLRECMLKLAEHWQLPEDFFRWVERENVFANTLVDQIVTGCPEAETKAMARRLGYRDELLTIAEPFSQWVIQGPEWLAERFAPAGNASVTMTEDLTPYRQRKVRMLNGLHTVMAAIGPGLGLKTVEDAMKDSRLRPLLDRALEKEILPYVPLGEGACRDFAGQIVRRFENPYNHHRLCDIGLNSATKFRVRLLPTIKDYAADRGGPPAVITLALAALFVRYWAGEFNEGDEAAARFARRRGEDVFRAVRRIAADIRLWGEDMGRLPGLTQKTADYVRQILEKGMEGALKTAGEGT